MLPQRRLGGCKTKSLIPIMAQHELKEPRTQHAFAVKNDQICIGVNKVSHRSSKGCNQIVPMLTRWVVRSNAT